MMSAGWLSMVSTVVIAVAASNSFLASKAALPKVADVMDKPKHVIQSLSSKVDSLELSLASQRQQQTENIKAQKAAYESQLATQREEIHATEDTNLALTREIEALNKSNVALRAEADGFRESISSLKVGLKSLQANISTAQEVIADTLNVSEGLFSAPAVQVLRELEQQDAAAGLAQAHASQIEEIAQASRLPMAPSFLQVRPATKDLLQSLMSSLETLGKEQNESEISLKQAFDNEFKEGSKRHERLLQEQAELNATKAIAVKLHERLDVAVTLLHQEQQTLSKQDASLRAFAKRVARARPTSLLQVGQEKHNRASALLPEVSEVLSKPKSVFQALKSKVGSLEESLAEVNQQGMAAVKAEKVEYEAKLAAQRSQNLALESMNAGISKRITKLKTSNNEIRAKTQKLTQECAGLTADLKSLRSNITTAQEFLSNALESSLQLLDKAPELKVLDDLKEKDAAAEKAQAHEDSLHQVVSASKISMLQTKAYKWNNVKTDDLVRSLAEALDTLATEQNSSRMALKETFQKEFNAGDERRATLLEEQAELNATEATASELHEKLMVALTHLEQTQRKLSEKASSLRAFTKRLGSSKVPAQEQAASLLQVGQEKRDRVSISLPEVSEVLSKPATVFEALNSKVGSLEKSLAEMNQQGTAAVKAKKAEYEAKLAAQRRNNSQIENDNERTTAQIVSLKITNDELRSKSKKLTESCNALTAELETLKANITTAQEFTRNALDSSAELLGDAPELKVLEELAQKDIAAVKAQAHEHSLQEVAVASKMSMLQTQTHRKNDDKANDLLKSLAAALDDLSNQQGESEAALKVAFEKEFNAGETRREALLAEQSDLNEKKLVASDLKERLTTAVTHLEQTQRSLQEKVAGLRSFTKRLGA